MHTRIAISTNGLAPSLKIAYVELVHLTDSTDTDGSRGIEMCLHKKFYEKLEDLMVGLFW